MSRSASIHTLAAPDQKHGETRDYQSLLQELRAFADKLGFQQLGVTDINLGEHPAHLARWLRADRHGEMGYMARNTQLRADPARLMAGTWRILSARMNYLGSPMAAEGLLDDGKTAYISRYALGPDYHKVLRKRLARIAARLQARVSGALVRAFVDSAPVLEKAIAEKAGLGWIGKNTLLLNKTAGSWFFLGEIFTNVPLPPDPIAEAEPGQQCGACVACIKVCPTGAITAPRQLDARRCISYLTIEHKGDIPEPLRSAIGNRIFGCDDCQLVCPWNRFAQKASIPNLNPREPFVDGKMLMFWQWSEAEFVKRTQGMALRRISYEQWRRNLAVALGNAAPDRAVQSALAGALDDASDMVRRHIVWALERHSDGLRSGAASTKNRSR